VRVVAGMAVVFAGAVGIGAAHVIGRSNDPQTPSMRGDPPHAREAAGGPKKERARSRLRRESSVSSVGPRALAAAASEASAASEARAPDMAMGSDPDRLAKQLVDGVRREPRDGVWARQMESAIREGLEPIVSADAGIRVDSVYCAAARCVVEGAGESRGAFNELARVVRRAPGIKRARGRLSNKQDGDFEYRVILARDGFDVEGQPTPDR